MPKQPEIQQDPQAEGFSYKGGLFYNDKDQMMTPLPDGRFLPIPLEGLRDPKKVIANTKAKTSRFAEITQAREMDAITKGQSFSPEQYRGRGLEESGLSEFESGGWMKGAIDPAHKGYCTPMTKATCTPHRKAFARRAKAGEFNKEDGGELNYIGLPEYGFGSWLKDNAGGLLKGASSLVSAIPIVGKIAGPLMNLAGSAIDAKKQQKIDQANADAEQVRLDEEAAAFAETGRQKNLATRTANIVNQDQGSFAATFEEGGVLGEGLMNKQPVINEYSQKANSHGEGIGGIPVDARGNPATVSNGSVVGLTEAGEVTWDGYVFSDKLKVNKK